LDDHKIGLCFFRLNDIIPVLENNTIVFVPMFGAGIDAGSGMA
jgi:hypothetical protein